MRKNSKAAAILRVLVVVVLALFLVLSLVLPALSLDLSEDDGYWGRFRGRGVSINVYNWGEYIADGAYDSLNVNRAFEELSGIRVNYTNFATNEEMYARLRSGNFNYDVIIPSDYAIARLASENMLLPLNFDNIPNFKYIGEEFLNPVYDPDNLYSAPYTWGYVGVIYNTTMLVDEDDLGSWDILWDEKYLGGILMFSNSRDAFAIAARRLGLPTNPTDPDELYACLDELKLQKPLVQAYVMDEIFDKMTGGEAAAAPYYVGDALTMMDYNDDLDFFIPEEGTNIFVDAMCIPAGSRNKEAAEMYINFMLEPEVAAENAEYIGYATPNTGAFELLDEETAGCEFTYPEEGVLDGAEQFTHLPADISSLMDQLWTELLSSDEQYNRLLVPLFLLAAVLASVWLNVRRARGKKLSSGKGRGR